MKILSVNFLIFGRSSVGSPLKTTFKGRGGGGGGKCELESDAHITRAGLRLHKYNMEYFCKRGRFTCGIVVWHTGRWLATLPKL